MLSDSFVVLASSIFTKRQVFSVFVTMASIAESISALLSVPPPPVPTSLHGQADRILRSAVVGRDGAGPAAATRQYKNSQDSFHSPNHHSPRPRGGRVTLASTMPANAAWGGAANSLAAGSTDLQVSYSEHHRINRIYEVRKRTFGKDENNWIYYCHYRQVLPLLKACTRLSTTRCFCFSFTFFSRCDNCVLSSSTLICPRQQTKREIARGRKR